MAAGTEKHLEDDDDDTPRWLEAILVLGDSPVAMCFSTVLFLSSIFLSVALRMEGSGFDVWWASHKDPYNSLGPIPELYPPKIFEYSPETMSVIKQSYRRDGVVAIRGLIPLGLLERLNHSSHGLVQHHLDARRGKRKRRGTQFFTVDHGVAFSDPPQHRQADTNATSSAKLSPFLQLAINSKVPEMISLLSDWSPDENIRLLRDIFLAKDDEEYTCGFHVDDFGFWPATPDSPGINAWVALDSMPPDHGGGFGLAVGSHKASWRDEAHYVTGATTTSPAEGFQSAQDIFDRRTGSGTCNIATSAPHLHRRMEETERVYSMQRGDVIFHDRWVFHRTLPFARSFVESETKQDRSPPIYRRYSLRYGPGSSTIPPGYGTEPSVLWDESNGGRTADEVCTLTGPWYPRGNPLDWNEIQNLHDHVNKKLSRAYEIQEQRKAEMRPLLSKQARHQQTIQNSKRAR